MAVPRPFVLFAGELPELLLVEHVQAALGLKTRRAARAWIVSGEIGQFTRIGRRLALSRAQFLSALAARSTRRSQPRSKYVELLAPSPRTRRPGKDHLAW